MKLNDVARNNISKIIKAKDLKFSDVQRKSKFKVCSFYRYLDGGRKISLEVLNSFSELLNVNPKLLIDKDLTIKKNVETIIKEKD
tara:strand:+ start:273 stop:527 length:255 start_codon:yes stop_codon:yes gene_type:complete